MTVIVYGISTALSPALPASGPTSEPDGSRNGRLALPGEHVPPATPSAPVISNTRAAMAAYAEAVIDGVAAELRRRLFRAYGPPGASTVIRVGWPPHGSGTRPRARCRLR